MEWLFLEDGLVTPFPDENYYASCKEGRYFCIDDGESVDWYVATKAVITGNLSPNGYYWRSLRHNEIPKELITKHLLIKD